MFQMFVDLGQDVYQREFEGHFLEVSADFYKVFQLYISTVS